MLNGRSLSCNLFQVSLKKKTISSIRTTNRVVGIAAEYTWAFALFPWRREVTKATVPWPYATKGGRTLSARTTQARKLTESVDSIWIRFKDWRCVMLHEIDFLLKIWREIPRLSHMWKVVTWVCDKRIYCAAVYLVGAHSHSPICFL